MKRQASPCRQIPLLSQYLQAREEAGARSPLRGRPFSMGRRPRVNSWRRTKSSAIRAHRELRVSLSGLFRLCLSEETREIAQVGERATNLRACRSSHAQRTRYSEQRRAISPPLHRCARPRKMSRSPVWTVCRKSAMAAMLSILVKAALSPSSVSLASRSELSSGGSGSLRISSDSLTPATESCQGDEA